MTHRRQFTAAFKAQVVLELLSGAKSSAERCREHQLASSVLADWKAHFLAHAASLFNGSDPRESPDTTRVAELERLVGRLPLENGILKKGYQHLAPTRAETREVVHRLSQHYPIRQLCQAFRCSRSRPYDHARYRHEPALKATIERLSGEWPTDGYRRITALLHREQGAVNRKHVARLMREMGLQRPGRARCPRTTNRAHPYPRDPHLVQGLTIMHPDHVWVGDITDIRRQKDFVS